jgi:hypothetical protein
MGDAWEADLTLPGGHTQNIVRAFEAVRVIRRHARSLQMQTLSRSGFDAGTFVFEYQVPLLYHTLRAVGYDSLSPFKRILALHSAALIIGDLIAHTP